ncbi:hypothetical protein [Dactylosporangium sp. NPDC050588]|uniref:hypothetical protein n=1 Tax=Dactylosporangium sp. NPDC050588 TaxID=3157211 RepID=UPI0033F2ACC3
MKTAMVDTSLYARLAAAHPLGRMGEIADGIVPYHACHMIAAPTATSNSPKIRSSDLDQQHVLGAPLRSRLGPLFVVPHFQGAQRVFRWVVERAGRGPVRPHLAIRLGRCRYGR